MEKYLQIVQVEGTLDLLIGEDKKTNSDVAYPKKKKKKRLKNVFVPRNDHVVFISQKTIQLKKKKIK